MSAEARPTLADRLDAWANSMRGGPPSQAFRDLKEAAARIRSAETPTEGEALRKALEPFAAAADNYGSIWKDELPIERSYSDETLPGLIGRDRHINIGDLRRARAALSPVEPEEGA